MPWGAVAGAAIGLVGDSMSKDKNGGAGTTSKEPWSAAQPWLLANLEQGQALQQQLQNTPFSPRQQAAYDNSYALSDYQRELVPSLLGQLSSSQLGFDASNPTARAKAFNFNATGAGGVGGLGQKSVANAQPAAAPTLLDAAPGDFRQQNDATLASRMGAPGGDVKMANAGGFGSFTYGMQPEKGTKAWRDLQEYLAWGGADPYGMYGKPTGNGLATDYGMGLLGGGNSGGSVGGSPAGDGSGGGSAGGNSW